MDNQRVTEQQAVQILRRWNGIGHDLPSLAKFKSDDSHAVHLLLPDYICNEWYQVGENYCCYKDALTYFGSLIDKSRAIDVQSE